METVHIEANYPITFRSDDAKALGEHLKLRHSVELVGAKRVGISHFLRFFLYHPKVVDTYIDHRQEHLFVPVDLNDLVEVEVFPFWILTFQRLVDSIAKSTLSAELKKDINGLFVDAIQSRDVFLTVEGLRKALLTIVNAGVMPTIFLIRFDRLSPVINQDFFANLRGLREATAQKLAYVFTSFRAIYEIVPHVFEKKLLTVFSQPMFLKPAKLTDVKTIFETFEARYNIKPSKEVEEKLIELCGGHVQYLHLSLIILNQRIKDKQIDASDLLKVLTGDERINLQSEEIWESLSGAEKAILLDVFKGNKITSEKRREGYYLWVTGIVREKDGKDGVFSPLFEFYLESIGNRKQEVIVAADFTKKENLLYKFLFENIDNICEREAIIENVWPESEELGVSDWTIDRLVARLRAKLKAQKSKYNIVTVKTRGYKLTS